MGLFDALRAHRPTKPMGATYWIDSTTDRHGAVSHVVRLQLLGQPQDETCRRVGPTFSDLAQAARYLDWLDGGPLFEYGPVAL